MAYQLSHFRFSTYLKAFITISGFKKIGDGFCRTSDGSEGKFWSRKWVSLADCEKFCLDTDGCVGIEYTNKEQRCEVHKVDLIKTHP